jgi:hypothetical protein
LPVSALAAGGSHVPQAVTALIDTGATTTCITSGLASRLNLTPIGKVPVHGVSGNAYHNNYLFYVAFPFALPPGTVDPNLPPPPPGQVQGQIFILHRVIQGCELVTSPNASFEVLLGMDVISSGSLVVQGNGTFSFSF